MPKRVHRKPNIVVVGSINMDLVARCPRLPKPGETFTGTSFATFPGGKGANQAVAVARLGGNAILVGKVGADAWGTQLVHGLRRNGVQTRFIRTTPDVASGVAIIQVDDRGQNAITVIPGANHSLLPEDVRAVESVIARADAVLVQLEIPIETAREALALASKHGVLSILDPAPVPPRGLPRAWRDLGIVVITPNETEAAQLGRRPCTHDRAAVRCLDAILQEYLPALTVLKRGARGALLHVGAKPCFLPAFPVQAVDTTAAGDAFSAALTVRLSHDGSTLGDAVRFANAAGALATTRPGAQDSMPTLREVQALLRKHPEIS